MTSAIPVQWSTNSAIKPTGSWSLWVRNITIVGKENNYEEKYKDMVDHGSYMHTNVPVTVLYVPVES